MNKEKIKTQISSLPRCIGIIMDGNRRWARNKGLPAVEGHRHGYETLRTCLEWVQGAGITHVIVYAFSTENWKRSEEEVSYLMRFMRSVLKERFAELQQRGMRIVFIGEKDKFPEDIRNYMGTIEKESGNNTAGTLGIALSYGGRAEIVSAVKNMTPVDINALDEKTFSSYLWTRNFPDADMIIRTGGTKRLSNFLLWQAAYAELYFTDVLWPDFNKEEFEKALLFFAEAKRNFGT